MYKYTFWKSSVLIAFIGMGAINAATLTSPNFSYGLGYNNLSGSAAWNTLETTSANTPTSGTTQGNFSFAPVITSIAWGSSGPTFPGRVLTTGTNYTGDTKNFTNTITGAYTGPTPGDAAPTPNYQISIVITNISIWGATSTASGGSTIPLQFVENTVGHSGATSSALTVNDVSGAAISVASSYKQLSWDPSDYSVSGTNTSRTFSFVSANSERAIDGYQVEGYILVTYDAIPEPASYLLLGLGGVIILCRHRRNA